MPCSTISNVHPLHLKCLSLPFPPPGRKHNFKSALVPLVSFDPHLVLLKSHLQSLLLGSPTFLFLIARVQAKPHFQEEHPCSTLLHPQAPSLHHQISPKENLSFSFTYPNPCPWPQDPNFISISLKETEKFSKDTLGPPTHPSPPSSADFGGWCSGPALSHYYPSFLGLVSFIFPGISPTQTCFTLKIPLEIFSLS